jgi:predicted Fe-Mo cluster-binding NifX family protein
MKIGIPLLENIRTTDEILAPSFNHTQMLGIYDVAGNTLEMIDLEQESYFGGFTDLLKELDIQSVISPTYSPVALKLFKLLDIRTYKASGNRVRKNISALMEGTLPVYTFADALNSLTENCDPSFCGSCGSVC